MLKVNDLVVAYGGIQALRGVSFEVPKGRIITLIGANGAGKSTTLKAIMNTVRAKSGEVLLEGVPLTKQKTRQIVAQGISLVPEGRHVFPNLSVLENLKMGAYLRGNAQEIKKDMEWVYELFPRLREREWQEAGTLSGGEQQMLAIARGLMARPKLLMMDEPSLGLAPLIVRDMFRIIQEINHSGVTILLVEQNANAALKIAHEAYVLETGRVTLRGTGEELLANDKIKEAYLGTAKL
ncbi:Branched-chain amino acid transport ATP-binding protein LivF [Clostridiaceae bacterium JG1575]|nr:Branched-chain amino acid transport ATP-binding protein LivF [Clostridiaceae bacterium JG1575]